MNSDSLSVGIIIDIFGSDDDIKFILVLRGIIGATVRQ
jgi:hypothetical protein